MNFPLWLWTSSVSDASFSLPASLLLSSLKKTFSHFLPGCSSKLSLIEEKLGQINMNCTGLFQTNQCELQDIFYNSSSSLTRSLGSQWSMVLWDVFTSPKIMTWLQGRLRKKTWPLALLSCRSGYKNIDKSRISPSSLQYGFSPTLEQLVELQFELFTFRLVRIRTWAVNIHYSNLLYLVFAPRKKEKKEDR